METVVKKIRGQYVLAFLKNNPGSYLSEYLGNSKLYYENGDVYSDVSDRVVNHLKNKMKIKRKGSNTDIWHGGFYVLSGQ